MGNKKFSMQIYLIKNDLILVLVYNSYMKILVDKNSLSGNYV